MQTQLAKSLRREAARQEDNPTNEHLLQRLLQTAQRLVDLFESPLDVGK